MVDDMTIAPTTVAKLDELMTAIRGCGDPRRATDEWRQVYRLLQKTELPPGRVTHVVGMRDVAGLAALIDQVRAPAAAAPAAGPAAAGPAAAGLAAAGPAAATPDAPSPEACKKAIRAFRKRLSLTILDEESKLGHGPLSKGADAKITAIVPPGQWPESVWQELVRQGKLRYIGHGLYEPTKQ